MASSPSSSQNSTPPKPSFPFTHGERETPTRFFRSLSNKEPSFSQITRTPPRLSLNSILPSSPLLSVTPTTVKLDQEHPTYQCISSVLKKDGQILSIAVLYGLVYTGSESNVIRVWKLPEFRECDHMKTKATMVVALEVCNDKVFAAYGDCKIRVWRRTWDGVLKHVRLATIPTTGSYVRSYITGSDKMVKHMGPISSLAINASNDIIYSSSLDKTVKVWRISDFKCIETIQAHSEPINAIISAHDGVLYTASDDATVRVWRRNFCTAEKPHSLTVTLPAKYSPIKTLALSNTSNGSVLYGGCSDGYIHYWVKGGALSGQLQYGGALQGHTHAVMCLTNASKFVISGSADSTSRVWVREQDGQHLCLAILQGHRAPIRCATAITGSMIGSEGSENGCTVCTGSLDGVMKTWRVMCNETMRLCSTQIGQDYFEF